MNKKHLHIILEEKTHEYLKKTAVKEKTTVTAIIEDSVEVRKKIKNLKN